MSSSLDDLEPYEIFRMELDDLLESYHKSGKCSKKELAILHHFIEFITENCKIENINFLFENFTILSDAETYISSLFQDLKNEEVIITISGFLQFIKKTDYNIC
ncbi:MAG: hypothetical protein ACK40G_13255 [Cytophagaceae bacterium]